MLIRAAQESDAADMSRVMVDTYLSAHRGQIPEEVWLKNQAEWTYQVSEEAWARSLRDIANGSGPDDCIYVAVDMDDSEEGTIVGLIMGGPADVQPWEHTGDIYALYIRPGYQRRGIGRQLIQAAAAFLRQRGMMALTLRSLPANDPANSFYESLGGQIVGETHKEEYGFRIPERIYGWEDSAVLLELH